jgi:molybdopterin molybdotransferase
MSDMHPQLLDPCSSDPHGEPTLPLEEALEKMMAEARPVAGSETLPLRAALGRVLARDVASEVDVPSHTNSAMDGYAVRAADLASDSAVELRVLGTAWAGRPFPEPIGPGECARIMTGASIPAGADTVVIQENAERHGDRVAIGPGHRAGQNVRLAGEDVRAGAAALRKDIALAPAHLGLLASVGVEQVTVRRRPAVAFFSTGDELRNPGESLAAGQIYDSNRFTIHGMLERLGIDTLDMGIIPDDREEIRQAFSEAARRADAIITSGGVSVGEADFVTETLREMGTVGFWKVAIKPGRPIAFGKIEDKLFFGLPGNPVSVMATFYQLVRPVLLRLRGEATPAPEVLVKAECRARLRKKPGRMEFQRGVLSRDGDGKYIVDTTGHQGAGVLRSMAEANCFIVLPLDGDTVMPGDEVDVQPFSALV